MSSPVLTDIYPRLAHWNGTAWEVCELGLAACSGPWTVSVRVGPAFGSMGPRHPWRQGGDWAGCGTCYGALGLRPEGSAQAEYGLKAIPIQVSVTSLLLPCHIQLPPNWTAPQCSPPGTKPSLMTTAHGQAGLQ